MHLHWIGTDAHSSWITKFSFIYMFTGRLDGGRRGGVLKFPHLCVLLCDSSLMDDELVSLPHLT